MYTSASGVHLTHIFYEELTLMIIIGATEAAEVLTDRELIGILLGVVVLLVAGECFLSSGLLIHFPSSDCY